MEARSQLRHRPTHSRGPSYSRGCALASQTTAAEQRGAARCLTWWLGRELRIEAFRPHGMGRGRVYIGQQRWTDDVASAYFNSIRGWGFFPPQSGKAMSDLASAIGIRADEQELVAELKAGSEEAFALL